MKYTVIAKNELGCEINRVTIEAEDESEAIYKYIDTIALAPRPTDTYEAFKTIMVAEFNPKKMHIYDVITKGKHPVRLIEGGDYITEYEGDDIDPRGDMYWYNINQKEYDYYRSQLKEVYLINGRIIKAEN